MEIWSGGEGEVGEQTPGSSIQTEIAGRWEKERCGLEDRENIKIERRQIKSRGLGLGLGGMDG